MGEDTIKLLQECDAGCKSATNSMEQVLEFLEAGKMRERIEHYNGEHIKLGEDCHKLLQKCGAKEKDPTVMAKTMSFLSTEIKMMMNHGESEVADVMVKGCDMGIKSLEKYLNEYQAAEEDSKGIAKRLIALEKEFREEMYREL